MGGKPWLNHYDPDVPHSLEPYPDLTLIDVLADNAHRRPNHPALLFKGSQLTYAELDKLSNGFASSLVTLGVEKGDRVAILSRNRTEYVEGYCIGKSGLVGMPINWRLAPSEIVSLLNDSQAMAIMADSAIIPKIDPSPNRAM